MPIREKKNYIIFIKISRNSEESGEACSRTCGSFIRVKYTAAKGRAGVALAWELGSRLGFYLRCQGLSATRSGARINVVYPVTSLA